MPCRHGGANFLTFGYNGIMKKILAVSGGVDSMVLLDLMYKNTPRKAHFGDDYASCDILDKGDYSSGEIIVAHFDHGTRDNSDKDAEFVRKTAGEIYHGTNIAKKGKLGENTSEEAARTARYEFLREVANRNEPSTIYTAHHLDDLVETVVINLLRGTGWRGLAVLDQAGVRRPLLEAEICYEPMDKAAIFEYAAKRGLHFREDQSNSSADFLRNRVRERLREENWVYEKKLEMWKLWQRQKKLRQEIDRIVNSLLPKEGELWQRKWFYELEEGADREVAQELLREGLLRAGIRATRPQIEDFRQAILHYNPGKKFNLPGDKLVEIGRDEFEL